jgi:chromosome segregation ATPase
MPISVPNELSTQVQTLEQNMQDLRKEAVKAAEEKNKFQSQTESHRATMSFWDRNLWGWFGNKEKIKRHHEFKSLTATFNEKAAKLENQASGIDAQVDNEIEAYLRKNDLSYQLLLAPHQAAVDLKSAAGSFLGKIDAALDSIGSAQMTETLDLFTDSALISVLSTLDNSNASSEISAVKSAAPAFQRAVETYNASLSSFKAANVQISGIDDSIDLMFDLVMGGGGFDFMSMISLFALNDAESDVKKLRGEVRKVDAVAGEHVSKTGNAVKAYKTQARQACRIIT